MEDGWGGGAAGDANAETRLRRQRHDDSQGDERDIKDGMEREPERRSQRSDEMVLIGAVSLLDCPLQTWSQNDSTPLLAASWSRILHPTIISLILHIYIFLIADDLH